MKFRDLIAGPFYLMSLILLFIAVIIGSSWTAKRILDLFRII